MNLKDALTAVKQWDTTKAEVIAALQKHIIDHTTALDAARAEIQGAEQVIIKLTGGQVAQKAESAAAEFVFAAKSSKINWRLVIIGAAALVVIVGLFRHWL